MRTIDRITDEIQELNLLAEDETSSDTEKVAASSGAYALQWALSQEDQDVTPPSDTITGMQRTRLARVRKDAPTS